MDSATLVPNKVTATSDHWHIRSVPRLGSIDHTIFRFLARSRISSARLRLFPAHRDWPISLRRAGHSRSCSIVFIRLARHHHFPSDPGDLVGQRHGHKLWRLAFEQLDEPGRGVSACARSHLSKQRSRAHDQGLAQVSSPARVMIPTALTIDRLAISVVSVRRDCR
jgi:hypothetical protein